MGRTKIEWANYNGKDIFVRTLSKEDYDSEYKGKLTCIHGCNARIRFTERKNGIKYFSTWNGEGAKHELNCEFHVDYKGKVGRKKLEARQKSIIIPDERIIGALRRKYHDLIKEYNEEEESKEKKTTKKVENNGEKTINVYTDDGGKEEESRTNITSINANHINSTYIEMKKCVIGKIKNGTINKTNGEDYGYLNLETDVYDVAVYFPEAFFKSEEGITIEEFRVLKNILNASYSEGKELVVVCYGTIKNKKKSKKEFNINIISKKHILINGKTLNNIISYGNI